MKINVIQSSIREAELTIYEDIGEDPWTMTGMSAARFRETLQGLGEVDRITVYLNSLGGSVFDGMTIFNELKNHPARITVKVMGIAASAASVIAMAAEPGKLVMAEGTFLMIHKAWTWLVGNADDMLRSPGHFVRLLNKF
jgi:ATP-dependent Clp protease protease subunit